MQWPILYTFYEIFAQSELHSTNDPWVCSHHIDPQDSLSNTYVHNGTVTVHSHFAPALLNTSAQWSGSNSSALKIGAKSENLR